MSTLRKIFWFNSVAEFVVFIYIASCAVVGIEDIGPETIPQKLVVALISPVFVPAALILHVLREQPTNARYYRRAEIRGENSRDI